MGSYVVKEFTQEEKDKVIAVYHDVKYIIRNYKTYTSKYMKKKSFLFFKWEEEYIEYRWGDFKRDSLGLANICSWTEGLDFTGYKELQQLVHCLNVADTVHMDMEMCRVCDIVLNHKKGE